MVRASSGFRHATRRKLKKGLREKFTVEKYIKEFKAENKVIIKQEPASQKGMPHPRFKGKVGVIKEKRGSAYVVKIKVGKNKYKDVIARPEHLKSL